MTTRMISLSILVVASLPSACDGGESSTNTIAAAMAHVAQAPDEASAKVHAKERFQALQSKVDADAAKAKAEAYAAIIALPASAPSLDEACASAATAYDAFMSRRLEGAALQRWEVTKKVDLDRLTAQCRTRRDARVAACQAHALQEAGALFVADDAPFILSKCEEAAADPIQHA